MEPLPALIGLSGFARVGKDTVADILAPYGYERRAFADPMRRMLHALNPWVGIHDVCPTSFIRLADLVDHLGWDAAKERYPEVRQLLQRLGTEGGRDVLGESVWVDTTLADLPPRCVIADVRFPNEADAIVRLGGEVWRISRPGFGPVNGHVSDNAMAHYPFDRYIDNDGTYSCLAVKVFFERG